MRTVSSALALASSAFVVALLAQGCGSKALPGIASGFDAGPDTGSGVGVNSGDGGLAVDDSGAFVADDAALEAGTPVLDLDSGCATATATTERSPVYLLFVLDGSGSMSSDSKWESARSAFDQFFDDAVSKADTSVGLGMIVYEDANDLTSDGSDFTPGPYPGSNDVAIRMVDGAQHTRLKARINTSPSGGTPTLTAMQGGYGALLAFNPDDPIFAPLQPKGKKVLIIASDGEPNGGDGEKLQIEQLAANQLSSNKILTFSIGIGPFPSSSFSGYDAAFMSRIAVAGGTKATPTCNPNSTNLADVCHFQVTPGAGATIVAQQLLDAMNKIRAVAAGCEYTLSPSAGGGAVDPDRVNVIFTNGGGAETLVPRDEVNGWTYDDPTNPSKVILHGDMCKTVTNDTAGAVRVILGCKTVVQ